MHKLLDRWPLTTVENPKLVTGTQAPPRISSCQTLVTGGIMDILPCILVMIVSLVGGFFAGYHCCSIIAGRQAKTKKGWPKSPITQELIDDDVIAYLPSADEDDYVAAPFDTSQLFTGSPVSTIAESDTKDESERVSR
jgi:hypothetical protein